MAFPVTLNGVTYTLANFEGLNYVEGFPDALEDFVTEAGTQVSAAGTSATNAATSETNAASSATAAASSATAAAASATAAQASLDAIEGLYLGAQSSDPTVDLNGDALTAGDWYFNTVAGAVKIYDGSAWVTITSLTFELVDDTTPQLGGNLDLNGNNVGGVTPTELGYVSGVTSAIQTQLDSKVGANYTGDVDITGELLVDSYNETFKRVTSSSNATTVNCENANVFEHELTENTTFTFSNPPASGTPVVTGYNLSGATFVDSFSILSQEAVVEDIAFNANGTKMFIVGSNGDEVNEYALSTGFDVSTASFTQNFSVSSQDTNPTAIAFNSDGTKMFIVGNANDTVYQYGLTTGFDISTASYSSTSFSLSSQENNPKGLAFNSDGTKMFVAGESGDDVNEYTLSTGFDVSTASYSQNFSVASQDSNPTGLFFTSDGTRMYITGNTSESVYEYTLTTGFDVSTASYSSNSFDVGTAEETAPRGVAFNSNGTKMFVVGPAGDDVNEYTTTTSTLNDSTAYAMSLKVVQDSGASGYTVTWPTSVDWPSATAPTLTATASAVDQFVFYTYDGGTTWYGFTAGQALA